MPWFRIDDHATFHPKVIKAGNACFGAITRMGAYCAGQLTDGFVPDQIARMIASKKELAKLLEVEFLERVEGGYQIHDYLDFQPSRVEVEKERQATRERVSRHRNGVTGAVTPPATQGERNGVGTPAPSDPIRSHPLRTEEAESVSHARARVDGDKLLKAWTDEGLPGLPAMKTLQDALAALPASQWPSEGGEERFMRAAVQYRADVLKHRRVNIPALPERLADPKHFPNIVEVMLGRLDLSQLAEPERFEGRRGGGGGGDFSRGQVPVANVKFPKAGGGE